MTVIVYYQDELIADRRGVVPSTSCTFGNVFDTPKIFISKDRMSAMGVTGEIPRQEVMEEQFEVLRHIHKRLLVNSVENIKDIMTSASSLSGLKKMSFSKSGYLHLFYPEADSEKPSIMTIDSVEARLQSSEKPICLGSGGGYALAAIAFGESVEKAACLAGDLDLQTGFVFDHYFISRTLWKPKRTNRSAL